MNQRHYKYKIGFMEAPAPWLVRQEAQTALGLLYLATVVKEAGYEVAMLKPKKLEDLQELFDCHIVCMGGTTLEYLMNVECARYLKAHCPTMKIFIGGAHVAAIQDMSVLNGGVFDSMCVGEGERVILEMIRDVELGRPFPVYKEMENLDVNKIPIPDRSLIPGSHGGDIFIGNENYEGEGNENFITSRGCHFNCAFCASKSVWGGAVRYRSVENIEREAWEIADTTTTRQLRVCDDNVVGNRARLKMVCDIFREYGFIWRCSARAESLSIETCNVLYNGGCREVSLGIESGDQKVLDGLNKNTRVDKMMIGCANARKAGLKVRALFMIGTPCESKDTPEINERYINRLDFDLITLATFIPLPGTPVWNTPEKFDCRITSRDFSKYNKDYYQSGEVRQYTPLIRNNKLTLSEQIDNVKRMEVYVGQHAVNKG